MCDRCRYRGFVVIYCVVPPELGDDAFRRLVEHYKDNPNVKVLSTGATASAAPAATR